MNGDTASQNIALLTAKIKVPQNVVYREFPAETVMLNLETGKYHGLNATAGRMLDVLQQASSVGAAAAALSGEYGQPPALLERDLCVLCEALLERGLVELDERP